MAASQKTGVELSGELEVIAAAAAERRRALTDGDVERAVDLRRRVGEAASRAIAGGLSLASIADAERIGRGERASGWGRSSCDGWSTPRQPPARSGLAPSRDRQAPGSRSMSRQNKPDASRTA